MKKINGVLMNEEECYLEHNRLIYSALKSFLPIAQTMGMDPEDLISEGKIGFIKAFRNFDDSLGYRFSSYAVRIIKFEVMKFLRDKGKSVKYPRTVIELANKINTAGYGELTSEEIAVKTGSTLKEVRAAFESMKTVESLQSEVFQDSEKVSLLDQLGEEVDFTSVYVKEFINGLEAVERKTVSMRLDGFTQSEIGIVIGVSQIQVSRLLKRIGERYLKVAR